MQQCAMLNSSSVLNDKQRDPKAYWAVLNNFLNKIKNPSLPLILISGEAIEIL